MQHVKYQFVPIRLHWSFVTALEDGHRSRSSGACASSSLLSCRKPRGSTTICSCVAQLCFNHADPRTSFPSLSTDVLQLQNQPAAPQNRRLSRAFQVPHVFLSASFAI